MKFDIGQLLLNVFLGPFMWAVEEVLGDDRPKGKKEKTMEGCVFGLIGGALALVFWGGLAIGIAVWWFSK